MPAERTPTGDPIPGTQVNIVDAIAYLSGVNYGSVVKVLAALNAIARHADLPLPDSLSYDVVPTEPTNPYDRAQHDRIANTDIFVRSLVSSGRAQGYECLQKPLTKFLPRGAHFRAGLTD